jgi:hypothetical protein
MVTREVGRIQDSQEALAGMSFFQTKPAVQIRIQKLIDLAGIVPPVIPRLSLEYRGKKKANPRERELAS